MNPLRSFEAAARHGSFTKAAEELHVTTVAVSRQIAVLEGYFGLSLFERLHHTVRLTPAGRGFLPKVTAALDLLDEASRELRAPQDEPVVVCTYPSFALRWLIPRLPRFRAAHPDIDITLTTAVKPEEFDYRSIDIGIQYVNDVPDELVTRAILPDVIQPVCSPKLLVCGAPLPPVENLRHHTLLHSRYRRLDWEEWLKAAGAEDITPRDELTFKGSGLTYQAAIEGLGVAVAQRVLVEDEIETGRLIAPFSLAAQREQGICMVSNRQRTECKQVATLMEWIVQEANATMDALGLSLVPEPGNNRLELGS